MTDMRGEQARAWVVRLASGAMSADELRSFDDWAAADPRNRAAFLRERQTWQDLDAVEDVFGSAAEGAPSRARRWPSPWLPAAAAALIAWFAVPSAWLWTRSDAATGTGQVREVALADGSRVVLDSDSAIAIDYDDTDRMVRLLKGRAWFAVRHGDARPFRVAAADGVVRDIGTAFEVDDTAPHTRVGVTEGAVQIETGGQLILRVGQRAEFGRAGSAAYLQTLPSDEIGAWRSGELLLREVPLEAAIRAIARYRSGTVFVLGNLAGGPPISGSFRTDRPDEALDTLAAMRGLERAALPGGILLLRPGAR
ncbi:MAG TPA: FecR domain-containing protein [Novosphingobium sp.]|nr:FecR domain-containing protein [Novosphingobium sp.]